MKRLPFLGAALVTMALFWPAAGGMAQTDTLKNKPASDVAKPDGPQKPDKLTVASWGGAYSESQKRAYFTPFQNKTGIAIDLVSHNGSFGSLSSDGASNSTHWDLVDLGPKALEEACSSGKLEKVDASALAAASDGTSAIEDFLPGMLHECGVPSVAWSSAIVYDKRAFKKAAPKTARDFFDIKRFPGKRALPRTPQYTLELALMADGVKPENVYSTLATRDGITRALKRLDTIRDHIVWWDRAPEPLKLLAKKEAAMAIAFNGRIFSAIVAESRPFALIWDGQVYDLDFWAIPKGSPNKAKALELIAFATKPDHLAQQARWFPYGPVRKSALKLIGKHPEIDVSMSDFIPTSDKNFKSALRMDASWWDAHEAEMKNHLKVWRTGDGGSAQSGSDTENENRSR
jgi:putative spermidine/putrescine transport system substrate-binding protein